MHVQIVAKIYFIDLEYGMFENCLNASIALQMPVGLPHLVQLITQERYALEASNLVGR